MPATSQAQQRATAIELARRRHGAPARRFKGMSQSQLSEFASTPREGLPYRAAASRKKRRQRIAHIRSGG